MCVRQRPLVGPGLRGSEGVRFRDGTVSPAWPSRVGSASRGEPGPGGGEGTAAAPGAVGPARLFSFLFQPFSVWISIRLRLLPRHTYTRDRRGFGDPAHPGSSTAARCPAPEMSHTHLSDKKSEIAKLGTEGARLGVSCPREQATPKEESLVEVPRFVGGGRGTGRGSGFGVSPRSRPGPRVHAVPGPARPSPDTCACVGGPSS